MPRIAGRAHVVRIKKTHVDKQGRERVYESVLLRRTYRDGDKVRNETLANLSMLPATAIAALEATLKGHTLVPADGQVRVVRALPHGHVAAVAAMARQLGLPALLGPACRSRDLVLALIISRVIGPASKLSRIGSEVMNRRPESPVSPSVPLTSASVPELTTAIAPCGMPSATRPKNRLARKGETMSTAEIATYAYDQIDQARAALDAVSK